MAQRKAGKPEGQHGRGGNGRREQRWDMKNYQADEYSDDSPGLYDVDDPVSETGSIFGKNLRSKLTSVRTSREYEDVEEGMVSNGDDEDWGDWEDDNAKEPIDGDAMPSEREEEEYSYEDGDEKDLEDENLEDASSKSTETPNGEDTALTPPALGAEDEAPAKEAQSEMTVVESSIVEDEEVTHPLTLQPRQPRSLPHRKRTKVRSRKKLKV